MGFKESVDRVDTWVEDTKSMSSNRVCDLLDTNSEDLFTLTSDFHKCLSV